MIQYTHFIFEISLKKGQIESIKEFFVEIEKTKKLPNIKEKSDIDNLIMILEEVRFDSTNNLIKADIDY